MKQIIGGLFLALVIFCLCTPSVFAYDRDRKLPDPSPVIAFPSESTPDIPGDANDTGWSNIDATAEGGSTGESRRVKLHQFGIIGEIRFILIKFIWHELTEPVVTDVVTSGVSSQNL